MGKIRFLKKFFGFKHAKSISLFVIIFLTFLILGIYLITNKTSNKNIYIHPNLHYSIEYPSYLSIRQEYGSTISINTDPPGYPLAYLQVFDDSSASKELAQLTTLAVGETKSLGNSQGVGYDIYKRLSDIIINDTAVRVFENFHVYKFDGKERWWVLERNYKTYVLSLAYLNEQERETYQKIFSSIIFQDDYTNSSKTVQGDNIFSLSNLKVGDVISNMTVVSINKVNLGYTGPPEKNYRISFSGQVTITGHYDVFDKNPNDQSNPDFQLVQFVPDTRSTIKLPREKSDSRNGGFGFRDFELAKGLLSPMGRSGDATVVIDNFTLISYPSEGNHEADLIEVK